MNVSLTANGRAVQDDVEAVWDELARQTAAGLDAAERHTDWREIAVGADLTVRWTAQVHRLFTGTISPGC